MPRDILTLLAETQELHIPSGRHDLSWSWAAQNDPHSFEGRMAAATDPVDRAIIAASKRKGRMGSHALALGSLRGSTPPQGVDLTDLVDWFTGILACGSSRLDFTNRRSIGHRQVPNYRTLQMGSVYLIPERIPTLSWSRPVAEAPTNAIRFNLIIPREISPRGTNVYGDMIIIEQPSAPTFVIRRGWRCWVANIYDADNPRSKQGLLGMLEDENHLRNIHLLDNFCSRVFNPWPFLINWTADGSALEGTYVS